MSRIYKAVGPSYNKAVTPVNETKALPVTPPKDKDDKKDDKKKEADEK